MMAGAKNVLARIQTYLGNGGLFNPELVNHVAVRELIIDCRAALEASEAARVKAEQERDAYRSKLMQLADATEVSGMSWSGFNVLGDKKSIKAVQSAVHYAGQIEEYRKAFADRLKQVEAERDALKEALQDATNALGSLIDTSERFNRPYEHPLSAYDRAVLALESSK